MLPHKMIYPLLCVIALLALSPVAAQQKSEGEPLSMEEFVQLEVTSDFQWAMAAYYYQKRNLIELRARQGEGFKTRGDFLAYKERNEFLLRELDKYMEIRATAFRKVYEEKGAHLDWEVLWERMSRPVFESLK